MTRSQHFDDDSGVGGRSARVEDSGTMSAGGLPVPPPASGPLGEDGLLELLLNAAPAAVAVYDLDGRVIRANEKAVALLGPGDVQTGDAASDSVGHGLVRQVIERGEPAFADEPVRFGGDVVTLSWHCHAIREPDGKVVGAMLVADDPGRTARLEHLAMTDPLTGVFNHGAFRDRLGAEVKLASRHGTALSLALIDVDEFKVINDTFGHQVGDRVLVDVVGIIAEQIRASDVLARVGGDEFAILMPQTDGQGAGVIAERAHAEVGAASVADGQRVTLSIGVCELAKGEGPEDLVGRTDRALYASKRRGRDMVWRSDSCHHALRGALADMGGTGRLARGQAASAVRALARAIDLKDPATRQHSDRVAELAVRLAETIGWSPERCEMMRQAAVVHDVGKVAVPDAILLKPGRLTDSEYAVIRRHAELGAQIAAEIFSDEQIAWLRGHHERFDGNGYPDGLAANDIPVGAQILAVTDAYDVMISDRPYAAGLDPTDALDELRRCSGTQFAPEAVEAFHAPRFVRLASIHSNQERSRAANRQPTAVVDGFLELRCECADPECTARVQISADELGAARAHQRRFVLADGHELTEADRVVGRTPRFIVIEKRM
jgi:diguanylate cyclase (GGDEF)-like protein/putative nucleotidyltransferase with HDIG domain